MLDSAMAAAKIFICADASPQIGAGHVMRCMALAQAALRQALQVHMVCRVSNIWVRERLERESIPFALLQGKTPQQECPSVLLANLSSLGAVEGDWVCLDGYHFAEDCHKALQARGFHLLVIDDHAHLPEYHCEVLLNQNLGAEELLYRGAVNTTLFGPRFALLRTEFVEARNAMGVREFPLIPQKILISLGGGDQRGELRHVLASLSKRFNPSMEIKVVLGSMNERDARESVAITALPVDFVKTDDLSSHMVWADLAITAGGSTCWELACLGTPFVVYSLADNQDDIVRCLVARGYAESFFSGDNWSHYGHERSVRLMVLVDGNGADRCITTLKKNYV